MKGGKHVIGVLDIQGSVEEHAAVLESLEDVDVRMIKKPEGLEELDGLIIPGGESTVMAQLMKAYGIDTAIQAQVARGMCVYGTCAGAILVSKHVHGETRFFPLGLMDITVSRNGYGRQLDSFETEVEFNREETPAVFIRAPYIEEIGDGVICLATHEEKIVAARNEHILVTTFHPELTDGTQVHTYFLDMCNKKNPA